jgi:predicted amidohydrolase YtcJ
VRPEDLRTIAVRMTVVAGRKVFDGERPGTTP